MITPCCNRFICPPEFPFANLSSEDPDQDRFIGWAWKWDRNDPPLLVYDFRPPMPCIAEDATSQLAADLAAQTCEFTCEVLDNCTPGNPGWHGPGGPVPLFFSQEQSATVTCSDGTPFTYTLKAGACVALHQADADLIAKSMAEKFAKQFKLCLNMSATECCLGSPVNILITATGLTLSPTVNLWSLTAGSLPEGLTLQQGNAGSVIHLTGIPSEAGFFPFQVTVMTPTGDSVSRNFTLCVVNIVTAATLPSGTVGSTYSTQLMATGCAATPLSWQVVGGSLPPGLLLDEETGVISGTPTGLSASYNFTIRLQTLAT